MVFSLALLAASMALALSPPGMSASAWYQSPISPISPVSTLPSQSPTGPSTPVDSTPMPAPEAASPSGTVQTGSGGNSTAVLVVGGIVLAGLIVGASILLIRGQPPDEPTA